MAALAVTVAGCATPVVLEHPATGARVNCTLEADRPEFDMPTSSTGADVPWPRRASPPLRAFDLEQQCAGRLLREGFVCVIGCTALPR